jgi:ABC-type multidrug transport system fused ATPase/permease subunit
MTKWSSNPALEEAVEKHIKNLCDSEKVAFMKAFSIDQDEFLKRAKALDDEHTKKSMTRSFASTLTNTLNVLQLVTGGLSVAVQAISVASMVVGGAKLVIDIGLRFFEYFDQLSDMLEQVYKFMPLLARYASLSHLPDICDACSDIYSDILRFYSATRKLFLDEAGESKKFQTFKIFLRSQWKPFITEFGEIKTSLNNRKAYLADSTRFELLDGQQSMQVRHKDMQVAQTVTQRDQFLGWLSDHKSEAKQRKTLGSRSAGTGDWLFKTDEYRTWASTSQSKLLWCHGKRTLIIAHAYAVMIQHLHPFLSTS